MSGRRKLAYLLVAVLAVGILTAAVVDMGNGIYYFRNMIRMGNTPNAQLPNASNAVQGTWAFSFDSKSGTGNPPPTGGGAFCGFQQGTWVCIDQTGVAGCACVPTTTTLPGGIAYTVLPAFDEDLATPAFQVSQKLICARLLVMMGITNATKLAFDVTAGGSAGTGCGLAIYPDSDTGHYLGSTGGVLCDSIGMKSVTGLAAFTLAPGTVVRECACAANSSPSYATIATTNFNSSYITLLDGFTPSIGLGTTLCDAAGDPPVQTGAITASAVPWPPLVIVSAE